MKSKEGIPDEDIEEMLEGEGKTLNACWKYMIVFIGHFGQVF